MRDSPGASLLFAFAEKKMKVKSLKSLRGILVLDVWVSTMSTTNRKLTGFKPFLHQGVRTRAGRFVLEIGIYSILSCCCSIRYLFMKNIRSPVGIEPTSLACRESTGGRIFFMMILCRCLALCANT